MSHRTTPFSHVLFFGMLVTYVCLTSGGSAAQRTAPGTDQAPVRTSAADSRPENAPNHRESAAGPTPSAPGYSGMQDTSMPAVRFFPPSMTRLNYLHF
ncbi:exported hypothetical protein [uncultured delta proteobacterium]|uniref:Secreted protein n=1 Tax=uncultured delta proteobacterium TaxID=34034 RepID=A0A212IWJ1_9DELT|nr:exported hypothetical protein [uncultured delta proteobacterium]